MVVWISSSVILILSGLGAENLRRDKREGPIKARNAEKGGKAGKGAGKKGSPFCPMPFFSLWAFTGLFSR